MREISAIIKEIFDNRSEFAAGRPRPRLRTLLGQGHRPPLNKEEQKISLGVRQLDGNPWDAIDARFPIGMQIKGKVRNLTAYGAFVEMEEGIDGMVHVSDLPSCLNGG